MRTLNKLGINLIKSFEGLQLEAYQDQNGVWTNGYGHTSGVNAHTPPITEQQAEAYLRQDLQNAQQSVESIIAAPLSDNQYAALVSLTYNEGVKPIEQTLGKLLNAGDYIAAANQFDKWIYAAGVKNAGLIRRRAAEKKLFLAT